MSSALHPSRRDALTGLIAGGAVIAGQWPAPGRANSQFSTVALGNGLRTHMLANQSRYVSAALILRSIEIRPHGGLAHLLEHTSFAGSAGGFAAKEVREIHKDCIQEGNASTQPGMIQWQVAFLPKYLEQVLGLLAAVSLDQRFDIDTVRAEAQVVLQELYLDKYHTRSGHNRMLGAALFGGNHPYGADTTESEIAKAKTPPERLAAELRHYAQTIRLPANMDLFLVGSFDAALACNTVEKCFGRFPFAQGPTLALPSAALAGAYRAFTVSSPELRRPLSEIKIAWNTGVCITHPDAKVVLALGEYLNAMLFRQLREQHGDAYSPEAFYKPDACSGIFEIAIPSTEAPDKIERKVFEGIAELKAHIDGRELGRFRDRLELKRRKYADGNDALLERAVDRAVQGASIYDLDLEIVTPKEVLAAAQKYLPSHKGAYVRVSLLGR